MNLSTFFTSYVRRLRSGVAGDPVRDWLILLTLWVFAFICIIIWNVWAFDTVAQGGSIAPSATSTPAVFKRSSIDMVTTVFQSRAVEESKYVTGVYRFTDPSQ
jgi:hypothetical protein